MDQKDLKSLKLVGLVGKSGSGKDRFFSTVLAPLGFTQIALADAVRVFSTILFTRIYEGIEWNNESLVRIFPYIYYEMFTMNKSPLSRTIQQYVGTELIKGKFDRDYWIKVIDPLVKERISAGIKVAITDVRFQEEADYVRKNGGILIKMTGKSRYENESPLANHDSEKSIDLISCDLTDLEFMEALNIEKGKLDKQDKQGEER